MVSNKRVNAFSLNAERTGMKSAVIVGEGAQWSDSETVIRWEEYSPNNSEISLPKLVEEDAGTLKTEYLAWIQDLSSNPVDGKTLPERLTIGQGISAWWAGTLFEKSFYKTPQIYDVLRLRALERCVENAGIKHLTLYIPNREINEILKNWCRRRGITYKRGLCKNSPQKSSLRDRLRHRLPVSLQAALFLIRYLWRNRVFLAHKAPVGDSGLTAGGLTVFSYFDNLDKRAVDSGRFGSLYWGSLPDLLSKQRRYVNWVFRFVPSALCKTPQAALELRESFALHGGPTNRFFLLEQWLSWRAVMRAILVYWKIRWKKPAESSVRRAFQFRGSRLNFWPLLRGDWRSDMSGYGAMENALTLSLFMEFASKSPRQAMGICLAEHQGWERALIQCWRQQGHKRIMGFAHSTLRFFDLRYFEDEEAYRSRQHRYDNLLVSGQFGLDLLRKAGHPSQELVRVEALRYLHLTSFNRAKLPDSKVAPERRKILVLTDYDRNVSTDQIRMLGRSIEERAIHGPFFITIKPHPNLDIAKIASAYLPAGCYGITHAPLSELLDGAVAAYTGNTTSASLDTIFQKLPTIIALSGAQINMSPLCGVPGVIFVTNPFELAEAINNPKPPTLLDNYFYLNTDLRLWRELLEH